ncbi:hypothetical protein VPH35_001730 [Triticum aestivum]
MDASLLYRWPRLESLLSATSTTTRLPSPSPTQELAAATIVSLLLASRGPLCCFVLDIKAGKIDYSDAKFHHRQDPDSECKSSGLDTPAAEDDKVVKEQLCFEELVPVARRTAGILRLRSKAGEVNIGIIPLVFHEFGIEPRA